MHVWVIHIKGYNEKVYYPVITHQPKRAEPDHCLNAVVMDQGLGSTAICHISSVHNWFQTCSWTGIFWTETGDLLHKWKHMASSCSMVPNHLMLDNLLDCRTGFGCWLLDNQYPDNSWYVYDVHNHKSLSMSSMIPTVPMCSWPHKCLYCSSWFVRTDQCTLTQCKSVDEFGPHYHR